MTDGRFPISRRAVLRGAGAALGLPWLEAMAPSAARAASTGSQPRYVWPCSTCPTE